MKEVLEKEAEMYAMDFLSKKPRKNYYRVHYLDDNLNENYYLQYMTDEEVKFFDELKNMYGSYNIDELLDEYQEKLPNYDEWFIGQHIMGIDTEVAYHHYSFTCHELHDDEKLSHYEVLVELSDVEYIDLLTLCIMDPHMNMNKLRYANKQLHDKITTGVDSYQVDEILFIGSNPYLITMDEVKSDAAQIVKEKNITISKGYMGYLFR